jgi:hypothetical protein
MTLSNAMNAGFSPKHHSWILEEPDAASFFEPGEEPRVIPKSHSQV